MSILGALGKALDKLDEAACTARAGHKAQKEAREFAATVVPGKTYYSVAECNWPWGKGRLLMEWVFEDRRGFATGQYMSGHLSAAGVWLSYGPIHATRPGGLRTFKEYSNAKEFPPDLSKIDLQITPAGV
jgi:hypothetical protein